MDCGPACLKIITNFFGRDFSLQFLREKCQITKLGVSFLGISEAAESLGLRTLAAKVTMEQLKESQAFPCILHWDQKHFVVLYKIKRNTIYISDPAQGKVNYTEKEFLKHWNQNTSLGVGLFFEPTQQFYDNQSKALEPEKKVWDMLLFYLKNHKWSFLKLLLGLIFSSAILLSSPFLTQAIVDKGIELKNLQAVYLILIGQLFLFFGSTLVDITRNWTLLHIGAKINISLISDFFVKLFKLPLTFFETHLLGDLLQRTSDHQRIESLIATKSLNVLFSIINLLLFGAVLFYYNSLVFFIFINGCLFGIFWVFIFMKKRASIEFQFFELNGNQQSSLVEMINGVEEIKISNSAKQKRWELEEIQTKIYKLKLKSLSIEQTQQAGFDFILKLTGIFLSAVTAKLVIESEITLGAMFAINTIIGQLTSPIYSLVDFIPVWQDAKLALLRINEVHLHPNETLADKKLNTSISPNSPIIFKDVSFSYSGSDNNLILKNINISIEPGQTTAIVGTSGSGKTTLLKLLLKFFPLTKGNIYICDTDFEQIESSAWREHCGVVLQGGKVFSDTIVNNIALGQAVNMEDIVFTSAAANLDDFVNSNLPMGYFTKIGDDGLQLSEGQKQRLLLARAMYKNPAYLFLDEATSALDAKNEREIMSSLNNFSKGKTVVIVAHRLSTVKNADKIIVLHQGEVIESGNHNELVLKKGFYFELIKEQLELGN
jgi:ATP-binding cassette subfamily B protein